MGIAGAAWGWTGQQFMNSTPHEFWSSYEIYLEMNKTEEKEDGGKC